jgi:hypothetical protein
MAPRPCIQCGHLTTRGTRCAQCEAQHQAARNASRPQYGSAYRAEAKRLRDSGAPCVWCGHPGSHDNPIVADHLDAVTLVPACRRCNARRATTAPVFGQGERGQ